MNPETQQFVAEQGYGHIKEFPNGCISVEAVAQRLANNVEIKRELWIGCVMRHMFSAAIVIFPERTMRHGFEDQWDYDSFSRAIVALEQWNGIGEPAGWIRHPRTGRRRSDGDPTKEFINP